MRLTFPQNPRRGPNSSSQSAPKNKGILSSSSRPQKTSTSLAIPANLSFITKVEEIRPNTVHANRSTDHPQGFFLPPDRRNGYDTGVEHIFRYQNNVFQTHINTVNIQALELYGSATVFSQATSTDHLLAVPFDARTKNVASYDYDWRSISFNHKRKTSASTYASLEYVGGKDKLPAPVPLDWNQLIPRPYRFQTCDSNGNPIPPTTVFGGLIGELPLLIALAAFSSIPSELSATLGTNTQGGRWWPHTHHTGRQYFTASALVLSDTHSYTRTRFGRHCLSGLIQSHRVYTRLPDQITERRLWPLS